MFLLLFLKRVDRLAFRFVIDPFVNSQLIVFTTHRLQQLSPRLGGHTELLEHAVAARAGIVHVHMCWFTLMML